MKVGPHDSIEPGTAVRVKNLRGTVTKAEQVRDQHGGPIMVHTIRITHRQGRRGRLDELPRPMTLQPNYSFIETLP